MIAPDDANDHRSSLITILQMAYSGEKAAAFAYQGHWRSVRDDEQRQSIRKIEAEEWEHRRDLSIMLRELDATPVWWREVQMTLIGRTVAVGCFLIGWFFPMYLAGQLESNNIDEYDVAAHHAESLGLSALALQLHTMAQTEHEHEAFFASMVLHHSWLPFANAVFGWYPERIIATHNSPQMQLPLDQPAMVLSPALSAKRQVPHRSI